MQLSQVRLIVQDFPRVFRFYRDVLGLVPKVDDERGPYAKLSFPSGTAAIALQAREHVEAALDALSQPIALASGLTSAILAIHVDSVDTVVEQLRSRGAEFLGEPRDQWGRLRVAYLRDPEGNLLELQEWLTV